MDHNLMVVERPANFEQYRWEVTCSCGWQGRAPTKAVAESLGTNHGGKLPEEPKKPVEKPKDATPATATKPLVPPAPKP